MGKLNSTMTNNAARGSRKPSQVIHRESRGTKIIERSHVRLFCITVFFSLTFVSLASALVDVTIIHRRTGDTAANTPTPTATDGEDKSFEQATAPLTLARGDIVDRNGLLIATTLQTQSLYANPQDISDPDVTAKRIVKIFPDLNEQEIAHHLKQENEFVWIKRNLTPHEQRAANNLGIPGLYFQPEYKRVYPYRNLLSHVVGYVGMDNVGLAGIEKYFDKPLRQNRDSTQPLKLSIDVRVQNIVHEELHDGIQKFGAIGATGIVLDLHSGEILAMDNLPDFDPNVSHNPKDPALFNRATLGSYEMGSTFKTFSTAMALDYGVVHMNNGYDASHPIQFAGYVIRDDHPKNRWLSIPEIYTYSSNIGTAKMIMDVGRERQQEFLHKAGLMSPVKIELPAPEIGGSHYPEQWSELNSMTISYGHGMSVTPLHLLRAYATMVNGGTFENLTLVKGGNDEKPKGERVISDKTSSLMRRLMRLVVEYGTGKQADVPGYRVGGKTGTAEKVKETGGYSRHANLTVFISTFPVDAPKYAVLVIFDEPKGGKETHGFVTAGWNSAPIAGDIIGRIGPMYNVKPVFEMKEDSANKYWVDNANQRLIHAASY